MILAQNVYNSTKHVGKYEERIIQILKEHFQLKGYEVIPHSSLNIAWGSIISDVDLLLIENQLLTYIEVKSSKDNLARAKRQIDNVVDYVDYAYVATEKRVKDWELANVGLIHIQDGTVTFLKKARRLSRKPRFHSVATLKKKCLARFLGSNTRQIMSTSKYELAQHVHTEEKCTRSILKEIVTCGELCATNCPIKQEGN